MKSLLADQARIGATGLCVLALLFAALGSMASAASAEPPNDRFVAAEYLGSAVPIEVSGSNVGATTELEEPADPDGAAHTIWFYWNAPAQATFILSTCDSDLATQLSLYEAELNSSISELVPAAATNGPGHLGEECEYEVGAGSYYIRVDGLGQDKTTGKSLAGEGEVKLRITGARPSNDDFADARPVDFHLDLPEGESREYEAENFSADYSATTEADEPMGAIEQRYFGEPAVTISGGASIWYRLTLPADWNSGELGDAYIQGYSPEVFPPLAVYSGNSLAGLELHEAISNGPRGWDYELVPGATYWLQIYARLDPETGRLHEGSVGFKIELMSDRGFEELRFINASLGSSSGQPDHLAPGDSDSPPTQPQTSIEARNVDTAGAAATFRFTSESGSRFRCQLDSASWKSCQSPRTYRNLTGGRHAFRVAAFSPSGTSDASPAVAHFKIAEGRRSIPHRHVSTRRARALSRLSSPAALGARAGGQENLAVEFTAKGTNGYRLLALAAPRPPGSKAGEGELGLFLSKGRDTEVTYAIEDATVTDEKIEADFGTLGRINLTRSSTGPVKVVRQKCLPEGKGRSVDYHWNGTVEFHGEEGFTEVEATSVRGSVTAFCGIPERGRPAGKELPGARLAVEREVGDEFQTSFSALQKRPGGKTLIGAEVTETKEGIEIHRGISVRAPARALRFDPRLSGAIVKPPAPFSGVGRFRARPGAPERARGTWTGSLTVDLPGHADLPVTGRGFRASLEHPRR